MTRRRRLKKAPRKGRAGPIRLHALERWQKLCALDLPLCLKTYTPEGTLTAVSPGLTSVFGYAPEEILGRNVSELTVDFTPQSWRAYLETIADKDKVEAEFRGRRKDGQTFLARATICPLRHARRLVGFFSICSDITEEKWLESARLFAELDTRLKEATALARVGRAITQEMELDRLLDLILDSLQETFHVHSSGILFLDEAADELYIRVARGYELVNGQKFRAKVGREGITGHAAGLRQPIYVPDVTKDPRYIVGSAAVRSELAIPLIAGERLLGVLDVQDLAVAGFSPAVVRVLTQFAHQAAIAIQNARLFDQVARAQREWVITFDSTSEAICIQDRNLTILRANRAFAQELGLAFHKIIGRPCSELLAASSCPTQPCLHAEVVADGRARTREVEGREGKISHVSVSPVLDQQGNLLGTVHVSRDVSSEKLLQQSLAQTEKLAALGRMIAGVAHELNNPLTVLLGFAQLFLGRSELPAEMRPQLERMEREAERASRIVQNLLRFARHQKPERQPVNINRLLEDALVLREHDLRLGNIALVKELADGLKPTAGDRMLLQQVFVNIIGNAYDALCEGRGRGTLRVATRMEDGRIRIDFEDDGPGIKEPEKVFEPFYTTKAVGVGTGLGLSICYGVVREHGGDIKAQNRPGGGAQFTVWLPILAADPSTGGGEGVSARAQSPARILVVDDEEGVLDVQTQVLEQMGMEVLGAGSGEEAVAILVRERPAAAVVDLKMPGALSGPQVYRWIQANRPELAARVLFVTGDVISGETRGFLESVGNRYLTKPFDLAQYRRAIQELLSSGS